MASFILRLILLLSALVFPVLCDDSGLAQFCTVHSVDGVDNCITLATWHNDTSGASDFYISLSGEFHGDRGWAGFGTGEGMAESMMFVFYPGAKDGELTVGIRSAHGHVSPSVADSAPHFEVRKKWADSFGYTFVELVCFSCDKWSGSPVSAQSSKQSWIWAANKDQTLKSDDESMHLAIHAHRGAFLMDMTKSNFPLSHPAVPGVQKGRNLINAARVEKEKKPANNLVQNLITIHGMVLGIAFMLLFPFGVTALRSGSTKGFKYHWLIQSVAMAFAFVGFCLALYFSWGRFFTHPHKIIGEIILFCLIAQPILGWRHHVNFVRVRHRTAVSYWHIWIGRVILGLGIVNVALGMYWRGLGFFKGLFFMLAVGFQVVAWIVVMRRKRSPKQQSDVEFMRVSQRDSIDENETFVIDDPDSEEPLKEGRL